jgi:hypothetical protein
MHSFLSPFIFIDLACLISAVLLLRKNKVLFWQMATVYVLVVFITELGGIVLRKYDYTNDWLYNIFILVEAGFNSYGFYIFLKRYKEPRLLIACGLVLIFAFYIFDVITHGFLKFNTLTTSVMTVMFNIYGLYYYYLVLKDKEHIELKTHAPFWWVTGAVFFYFGSIVSDLFFLMFKFHKENLFPLRYYIYVVLNCILYGFWTYSFLCRYRQITQGSS